jgi:hypothetical protein
MYPSVLSGITSCTIPAVKGDLFWRIKGAYFETHLHGILSTYIRNGRRSHPRFQLAWCTRRPCRALSSGAPEHHGALVYPDQLVHTVHVLCWGWVLPAIVDSGLELRRLVHTYTIVSNILNLNDVS